MNWRCLTTAFRFNAFALFLTCLGIGLSRPGMAQEVTFEATATALAAPVHLRLGKTTLKQALQAISDQAGIPIRPADYLEERVMIVQFDNLSARAVLDSLAECHDWVWHETEKGVITVERPKVRVPSSLLEVSPAFAAVVPLDMRRFLGRDLPEGELRANYSLRHPKTSQMFVEHTLTSTMLEERLARSRSKARKSFITGITRIPRTEKKMSLNALTPSQKQDLLDMFVVDALYDVCTPAGGAPLLICGPLPPDRLDTSKMVLYSHGGHLTVGTAIYNGVFAFGEAIAPSQQLPDPLAGLQHP